MARNCDGSSNVARYCEGEFQLGIKPRNATKCSALALETADELQSKDQAAGGITIK
jgi:hypothetical protein